MRKYKFSDIAENGNEKRMPTPEDKSLYIAPNNLDTTTLSVPEFGYKVDLNGIKLVMHKGDMLFGRREPQLKKAAVAPHDGLFSAHGMIFHPREEVISRDFFPFFISSDYFFDAAIRISVGSLSPTVNWRDLKDLEFEIPDLDTQRKYSKVLWSIIQTKKAYIELIKQLDELIRSRFLSMFGDPRENTMKWDKKPLKETCSVLTGNTPSRKIATYYGSYIEWIKSDNISTGSLYLSKAVEYLSESGANVGRIVSPGSILMTCIAGSLNTIGNIAIVDRKVAFNQQINAITPHEYETMFLYYLLNLIRPELHDATNKALKCILNKGNLESISTIVPDREKQRSFAEFATQIELSKEGLTSALNDTNSLHKTIIDGLFNGKE